MSQFVIRLDYTHCFCAHGAKQASQGFETPKGLVT